MAGEENRWVGQGRDIATGLRWRRFARQAWETDLPDLRARRDLARRLKHHLDTVLHVADARLALPPIGNQTFPYPPDADWTWRPELWCGPLAVPGLSSVRSKSRLGAEAALFHDCPLAEITMRQLRNQTDRDLAAYGLRLEVFKFDGSYLSLAIDLPAEAGRTITKDHLIRVDTSVEVEKKIEIFARLNIRNGPNTEQIVREVPLHADEVFVEFDLAYTKVNDKRVERMWLDLIFEAPQMNQIALRDMAFSRRRRAAL